MVQTDPNRRMKALTLRHGRLFAVFSSSTHAIRIPGFNPNEDESLLETHTTYNETSTVQRCVYSTSLFSSDMAYCPLNDNMQMRISEKMHHPLQIEPKKHERCSTLIHLPLHPQSHDEIDTIAYFQAYFRLQTTTRNEIYYSAFQWYKHTIRVKSRTLARDYYNRQQKFARRGSHKR